MDYKEILTWGAKNGTTHENMRPAFRERGHRFTPKRTWMAGHNITWVKDGKKVFSEMVCTDAACVYAAILYKYPDFIPTKRFHQMMEEFSISFDRLVCYTRIDVDYSEEKEYKRNKEIFKLEKICTAHKIDLDRSLIDYLKKSNAYNKTQE